MGCDLICEALEFSFALENPHVECVHINEFSNILLRALIWNQGDMPDGHLMGLCRKYGGSIPLRLLESTSSLETWDTAEEILLVYALVGIVRLRTKTTEFLCLPLV
jgi:hypothetical protein